MPQCRKKVKINGKAYTSFTVGALHTLEANPGLTASGFAEIYWPHLRKAGLLAAINLGYLVKLKLIRPQFVPPFHKPGRVRPQKRYYLTDKGYTIHDADLRQTAYQDGNSPDGDRTGRPGDGSDALG